MDIKKILRDRASVLAKPRITEVASEGGMDGLGFLLADEQYIIDSAYVSEVIPLREFTPLPCTPSFILGIINVRGRILSVINLKTFLNLPEKGLTNLNRVVIVRHQDIACGILVDDVSGKIQIFPGQLSSAIPTLTSAQKEYLMGVTQDRSIVLDIEKFLSDDKIIICEEP
jgi:purine-binding chemotaxis protein CheW